MKFLWMGYMAETAWQAMSPGEQAAMVEECLAYNKVLLQNGNWTGAGVPLQNVQTAKTMRQAGGKMLVTDGPYAETKEQLGGLGLVEAENIDEAVAVMAQHPSLRYGPFEIRPLDPEVFSGCTIATTPDDPADGEKIVCLGCFNEAAWDALSPEGLAALRGSCMDYGEVLKERGGTAVLGAALQGAKRAKTLRSQQGRVVVTDGPFAETKEQIGGVAIYRFRDMDQAIEAWRDHPCLKFGDTFELRPADEVFAAHINAELELARK
jgi:hypothetical protein